MNVVLVARGHLVTQVHRERGSFGTKGGRKGSEFLSGDDFLVTCLGGATESRAGSGRTGSAVCVCLYVRFEWSVCALAGTHRCAFNYFF